MSKTVATLHGGIGGGMLGFVQAGYHPVWAADDRDFISSDGFYKSWHGFSHLSQTSLPTMPVFLSPQTVVERSRLSLVPYADVLVGSPPCKRFSSLAIRKKDRLNFNPHELEYIKFLEAVSILQPKIFVLENLPAIEKHFKWSTTGYTLPFISEVGSEDALIFLPGYEVRSFILNAVYYGVPQNRNRLYVLGIQRALLKEHTFPNFGYHPVTPGQETVRDAFRGLTEATPNMEVSKHSAERVAGFAALEPGTSYYNSANNRRLFWDRPSWAVTSHRSQMVHPEEPRTLTVREGLRLMGFPDTFVLYGSRGSQFDQSGCGVCPPVTRHIAEQLKELF